MGKKKKNDKQPTFGEELPKPVQSFKELYERYDVPKYLKDNIKKSAFKGPTSVQSKVLPIMLDRKELICSSPTGSGKTLAFVLPTIHQLKEPKRLGSFRAIILTPTRELAKQIHREALWLAQGSNLRIHHLKDVKEAAKKFNPDSLYKYDILVTTPNKLSELLVSEPPAIRLNKLEWLILDECDRLFDLGFKDDLTLIYKSCIESNDCKRALFSATLDKNLVKWAQVQMDNVAVVVVGGKNRTAATVDQELVYVGSDQGKMLALRELISGGIETPVLIFVDTKSKAKILADEFMYDDLYIDFIHSERDQKERDEIVAKFREGKIWFLVCTDLMGRGIDFKGVNVVINYDCPKTTVSYIHRIGRTGRAGRQGKAITFVADSDRKNIQQIVKLMKRSGCDPKLPDCKYTNFSIDHKRKKDNSKNNRKGNQDNRMKDKTTIKTNKTKDNKNEKRKKVSLEDELTMDDDDD